MGRECFKIASTSNSYVTPYLVLLCFCRFALAQATVEQGKFLLAGKELEKDEKLIEKQKAEWSAVRLRKENISAAAAERRRRLREK